MFNQQELEMPKDKMIAIENINIPGRSSNVNATKYLAMREVLLKVLPTTGPGFTQAEMGDSIRPHLPQGLWPHGEKSTWWLKTVQLDLEAKGLIVRDISSKPARWRRA
jgi:hypothetical protein